MKLTLIAGRFTCRRAPLRILERAGGRARARAAWRKEKKNIFVMRRLCEELQPLARLRL